MTEDQARELFRDHCQPGSRGTLEHYGEKAAVAAIMAVQAATRERFIAILTDELGQELGDSYDCTRVWSAWGIGTMDQDDFEPLSERVDDIAEYLADKLLAPSSPTPEPKP